MLSLNELWFILVAVLFVGFFFLEGFDFGVGMSTKFLARTDGERRTLINAIGPFWDANEVWLITAGGAMFAAFPHWYATLFSGYYAPFVVVLLALIARGVSFEFRGKVDNTRWKFIAAVPVRCRLRRLALWVANRPADGDAGRVVRHGQCVYRNRRCGGDTTLPRTWAAVYDVAYGEGFARTSAEHGQTTPRSACSIAPRIRGDDHLYD